MSEQIDWAAQAKETAGSNEEQLDVISELTKEMLAIEDNISELEEKLKDMKKKHLAIAQGTLPEAMIALGLTSMTHESGRKLTVETFYQAKIPEAYKFKAFEYLRETDNDSIIKTDVGVKFGKGEIEAAKELCDILITRHQLNPDMKTGIHHSTLKAFVKEQIESGVEGFPQDLFGVYVGNRVKVR